MDETRDTPLVDEDILLSFVDWLDDEVAAGYSNTVWDGGVGALVYGYTGSVPKAAMTALADYEMLTLPERERAIERATSIVLKHLTHRAATENDFDKPIAVDSVGLHPDFVSWAGNGTGYKGIPADSGTSTRPSTGATNVLLLKTMPYQDFLRTDHWQHIRYAALQRADHRCQLCNSRNNLQVHHRTYERRGGERDNDVIVLCDACHSTFHEMHPGFTRRTGAYRRGRPQSYRAQARNKHASGDSWLKGWLWSLLVFAAVVLAIAGYNRAKVLSSVDATATAESAASSAGMATYDAAANGTARAFHTTPPAAAASTPIPAPTQRYRQSDLIYASWVAFAPEIGIRFFAPPSIAETSESNGRDSYHLRSPSTYIGGDYEVLDIYRIRNQSGGNAPGTWKAQNDAFLLAIEAKDYSVTFGPSAQQIGSYMGQRGQFNYAQSSNDVRISGTMWVGQVNADIVVIIYRCAPDREQWLDREMTQIMDTIDFNAR